MSRNLLIFFALILAVNTFSPVSNPSEARFALMAQISLEKNSWLIPMFYDNQNNLIPYYSKPPLFVWCVMFFSQFLPLEMALRLPSLLSVIGYFFFHKSILRKLKQDNSPEFRFDNYPPLIVSASLGITDPIFGFLVFVSCGLTLIFNQWFLAGIIAGLAVLTKGPIGYIFCCFAFIVNFSFRNFFIIFKRFLIFSFGCFLSSAWWFLLVWSIDGNFLKYFFLEENIFRFLGKANIRYGQLHVEPFGLAAIFSALFVFPYFYPFISAVKYLMGSKISSEYDAARKNFLKIILLIVLFFSFSRTILLSYLLPLAYFIPLIIDTKSYMETKNSTFLKLIGFAAYFLGPFFLGLNFSILSAFILISLGTLFLPRANLSYITPLSLGVLMIVFSNRTNFDKELFKNLSGSKECLLIKTLHNRLHSLELYSPIKIVRIKNEKEIKANDCLIFEKDERSNFPIIMMGSKFYIARSEQ